MSFNNPLPMRLKEARKKAELSQKSLGVRIGMDESAASARMNQYERGRHTPDINTLKLIANELDVPLSYFFCEDERSAELAVSFHKLSADDQLKVIEITAQLLANSEKPSD